MLAQGSPETSLSLYHVAWHHNLLWKTLGSYHLPPVFALKLVCDLDQVFSRRCQLWNVPVTKCASDPAFPTVKGFQNYKWQELFITNTFTFPQILHYSEVRSMLLYNRNFFHPFPLHLLPFLLLCTGFSVLHSCCHVGLQRRGKKIPQPSREDAGPG